MPKRAVTYLFLAIALFIFSGCSPDDTDASKFANNQFDEESHTENEHSSTMSVHFIDVGQADATLIKLADEEGTPYTILIDTGDWNASDVVSYLEEEQIDSIDIISISHPHADHIGQLDQIIEKFDVSEVWMNGDTAVNSVTFYNALAAIETHDVEYFEPELGDIFDIGPAEITVLHPESLEGSVNDNSLVLHLLFDEVSFLFTGDAEEQAEKQMLERSENVEATILHVGHHGSDTSTSSSFLQAVNPEIAIYSAGRDSPYDHPHEEVLNRIEKKEIPIYGTDSHGTIIVETDGSTYTIQEKQKLEENNEKLATTQESVDLSSNHSSQSCLDINTASKAEIQQIVHIGPERAQVVIDKRPFNSIDELTKIEGIGSARLKDIKIQGFVCTGGE